MTCDCGNFAFLKFGPYPQPGESDTGLRMIYTCTECGDQLRLYQGSKMVEMWGLPAVAISEVQPTPKLASDDPELHDWLLNASNFAGDFLKTIAWAGLRADWNNYPQLRPVLLHMKDNYPEYAQRYTGFPPKSAEEKDGDQ